jgi:hypothetical protein
VVSKQLVLTGQGLARASGGIFFCILKLRQTKSQRQIPEANCQTSLRVAPSARSPPPARMATVAKLPWIMRRPSLALIVFLCWCVGGGVEEGEERCMVLSSLH